MGAAGADEFFDRMPRQHVLLGVEICGFSGGAPTRHRIKDLSATGARVDRASMLKPGSTVLVSVGQLEAIGATVVWVKDEIAGLKFAGQIDPEAARSKTIMPSTSQLNLGLKSVVNDRGIARNTAPAPTAGWVSDLSSPYRR